MVLVHRSFLGRNLGVVILHVGLMVAAAFELGLALSLPGDCIFGRDSLGDTEGKEGVCDFAKATGFLSFLLASIILFFAWWLAQNSLHKLPPSFYRWASLATLIGILWWLLVAILVSVELRRTCQNNSGCGTLSSFTLGQWVVAASWVNLVCWCLLLVRDLYLYFRAADYEKEEDEAIEAELQKEALERQRRARAREEMELRRAEEGRSRDFDEGKARYEREREAQARLEQERDDLRAAQELEAQRRIQEANEQLLRSHGLETERRNAELLRARQEREAAEWAARLAEEERNRVRAIREEDYRRQLRLEEEDRERALKHEEEDRRQRERLLEAEREAQRILARATEMQMLKRNDRGQQEEAERLADRLAEEERARARAERLRQLEIEEENRKRALKEAEARERILEAEREAERILARAREEAERIQQQKRNDAKERELLALQAEREKLQQESERMRKEEEARRKKEEEEARRRKKEEEEARLRKEEEARKRKEEEARLRREEEARRRKEEEEARLRREAEEARRRKEEELRAEQQRAAEAERKRREAERLAEMEEENKAEAARLAALAEANRLAQQELLAEEERTRADAARRERAKALRKDGDVVPRKVTVPRTSYETLKKARPQIEAETKTSIDLTNNAAESSATVSGDSQNNVDNASHKIEDLINEDIRRDFGLQRHAGDAEPEYMSWLKGKKTNMVVALSKIYDKYPQVLAIKRTFDSVDARDGISHGYLDKNEFVDNFETLFPMCKKGMGREYAAYLFNSLDEDGNGTITWKEFIFYCLSNRLIVLNEETPSRKR